MAEGRGVQECHRMFVAATKGHRDVGDLRAIKIAQDRMAIWKAEQAGIA